MAKRVEIVWNDAASLIGAWDDLDAVLSKAGRSLVPVHSIGYLLDEDANVLILAAKRHGKRVGGVIIIPRALIVSRRRLK